MPKLNQYAGELRDLIGAMLKSGDKTLLEAYLTERGNISTPMANLPLTHAFANVIGTDFATEATLNQILDPWDALGVDALPHGNDREILPMCAVLSYGHLAVSRPDWWDAMTFRLFAAAADERWRIREMAATAFQRMLDADWSRAFAELRSQVMCGNPLVLRALVAAVAEPPILTDQERCNDALRLQEEVAWQFAAIPAAQRADEHVRVLRQGLGYSISVAVAAVPDKGFALLGFLACEPDKDLQWIVRENLKKNRLHKWPDKVESIRAAHG
jgi:hypothetical protein